MDIDTEYASNSAFDIYPIPHVLNYFYFFERTSQNKNRLPATHNIAVIGDARVGKSTLVHCWVENEEISISEELWSFCVHFYYLEYGMQAFLLSIMDLEPHFHIEHLRQVSKDIDLVVICYSIDDRLSFQNVARIWSLHTDELCPTAPKILVAMKKDLRSYVVEGTGADDSKDLVTYEEGRTLALNLSFSMFIECSAETEEGIVDLQFAAEDLILS